MLALFRSAAARPAPTPCSKGFFARIDAACRLWRERDDLARLDERMLRDIGLSGADVLHEKKRPAWDAPGWWR